MNFEHTRSHMISRNHMCSRTTNIRRQKDQYTPLLDITTHLSDTVVTTGLLRLVSGFTATMKYRKSYPCANRFESYWLPDGTTGCGWSGGGGRQEVQSLQLSSMSDDWPGRGLAMGVCKGGYDEARAERSAVLVGRSWAR